MTNWMPQLIDGDAPLYVRLADRIEADIATGVLEAGHRLPPQRDLAYDIGVTVGTVGRAYALARERGLVSGEVGRGTYVRAGSTDAAAASLPGPMGSTRLQEAPDGKTRFDSTAAPQVGQSEAIGLILAEINRDHPQELASYTRQFPERWCEAGAVWLSRNELAADPACIVPTLGVHAGVMAVIAAVTSPGDFVVFERVSYSQLARSAGLMGRRIALVATDEEGVDPDDFERLCAQRHPKIAFLMPTVQNPTLANMPEERRRRIVEIARKYNVWLVEDDLYGALTADRTPLLASLAPERTFLAGGLSKSVAAGVRGGWVMCPGSFTNRIRIAHKMATGGMPFLLAELCSRLVLSGLAADIKARCIAETNARLVLARKALAGHDFALRDNVPFIWLELPDPWLSGTFKHAAFERGLLIDDEDEFKAGRTDQVFHRVRLGVSTPRERSEVEAGLGIVRRLLDAGRAGHDSFG